VIATATTIDRAHYRAAREACRSLAPGLFFASHFLPRRQRHALYVLAAVVRQLEEIIDPGTKTQAEGCPGDEAACVEGVVTGTCATGGNAAAGGCATCGGESPQQRRAVCAAVLDFLYSGQKTGKPELDGFLAVVTPCAIARESFDAIADGLSDFLTTRRFATWNRLRQTVGQSAGAEAALALAVLRRDAGPLPDTAAAQMSAWATSLRLASLLPAVGAYWKQGRLILPLEDLVKHGLSERDLDAMTNAPRNAPGPADDPRWVALMRFECDRLRTLHRGGAGWLTALTPAGARAAAIFGRSVLRRLDHFEAGGFDSSSTQPPPTLWSRLRHLPAAVGAASRRHS
jgi:phytoene/squalene synthetase